MGTLLLNQIKKQACSFLQEKYKNARIAFTDVSHAELLAEEATNSDPWGPDTKTMTEIAEASFSLDNYWRIVDVLHKRLDNIDWKQWRQAYKTIVLIEFLLTHGSEEFAREFHCYAGVIIELGTFQLIDEKGFNWGANMRKRSDHVLKLMEGGDTLKEERLRALKITKEIHGFGSNMTSPTSPSSPTSSPSTPSSATSDSSRAWSFSSFSTASSILISDFIHMTRLEQLSLAKEDAEDNQLAEELMKSKITSPPSNDKWEKTHLWNCNQIQETGSLMNSDVDVEKKKDGFISGFCSKLVGSTSPKKWQNEKLTLRRFSKDGRPDRQFYLGY